MKHRSASRRRRSAAEPLAFLSYTRIDDEFSSGAITRLGDSLQLGVRVVTGDQRVKLFQDAHEINCGESWEALLARALGDASLLVPFITPLYFASAVCRHELETFLAKERKLRRDDMILPVYFVTTPQLEERDHPDRDRFAIEIGRRQSFDWRPLVDLPKDDPSLKRGIRRLSEQVAQALDRAVPS